MKRAKRKNPAPKKMPESYSGNSTSKLGVKRVPPSARGRRSSNNTPSRNQSPYMRRSSSTE